MSDAVSAIDDRLEELFSGSAASVRDRSVRHKLPVQIQRRRYRRLRQRYGLGKLDAATKVAAEWDEALDTILRRTKYDEKWLEASGQIRNKPREKVKVTSELDV